MMKNIRNMKPCRMMLTVVFLLSAILVHGQSVTYNHDSSVMNQFTIGETGLGSLTPDAYYSTLHRSYRTTANVTNKQLFRAHLKLALTPEVDHALAIDSALNDRKRVESGNIADRTHASDVAWLAEKDKITSKLDLFKDNIESITTEGGSASSYIEWMERYNAITCGLQAVRDGYMPQGKRKEQYLAIYRDILVKNTELCEYLNHLRSLKAVKNIDDNPRPVPRTQFGVIARTAHERWKVALSAGSGGVGSGN